MSLKQEIRAILRAHDLSPRKRQGQHFLVDRKDLRDIAAYLQIRRGESVVEVGAGVGNLTRELLGLGARVLAVEKDERLAAILTETYGDNIDLRVQDILALNAESLPNHYKLVGNIPYYLTAPLIRKFLAAANPPERIVLTVQKEVGERIVARPPHSTFLAMMVAAYGRAKIKKRIPAGHFWPAPKVDSVALLIEPTRPAGGPQAETYLEPERFVRFLKQAFRQPRKTLLRNLVEAKIASRETIITRLRSLGLAEKVRAHEVSQETWRKLYQIFVFRG